MTDTTDTEATTEGNRTHTGPNERRTDGGRTGFTRLTSEDLRGILDRLALAALAVLALVAGWSFYGHAGTAIRTWLDPAYQPIALAGFNLIVLCIALVGVIHQLYRIRADDGSEPGGEDGHEKSDGSGDGTPGASSGE